MNYLILTVAMLWFPVNTPTYSLINYCDLSYVECGNYQEFVITAYNTVPEQTSGNPCISASGKNICGIDNALACPREYPFGTKFEIEGKIWICYDRTNLRYNDRLDLSFDKDIKGAINFGKQIKRVKIYEN
jgi:3D (Asp-Asp-Asp) domain-containing protein